MPVVSRGYDPELEPMGTLPEYRRMGLAKALLVEGFRRLARHDPTLLYIGGGGGYSGGEPSVRGDGVHGEVRLLLLAQDDLECVWIIIERKDNTLKS